MDNRRKLITGSCVLALCLAATAGAEAKKALKCANPAEVTAMQASAVQQELMDAALTCGEAAQTNYNAFQTSFGPELRRSDKTLLKMFRRVLGFKKGDAAYNLYKTELASKAELRRLHGHQDFCTAANLVITAALAPERPSLNDFVSGIQVRDIEGPVASCQVEVAVTLQGAMAGPDIVPKPNPLRVAALTPPVVAPAAVAAPEQTPVPLAPVKAEPKEEKKSGWFSGLWN
ncbi:MAG: hypothetical protein ABSD21_05565 [Rhizomicrobium sp.]|jgi:hypothetical protein